MKETMRRSYLLWFLVIFSVVSLCFSQGYARKLVTPEGEGSSLAVEENLGFKRVMVEVMDYDGPGANTNPYVQIPPEPPLPLSPPDAPSPE